MFESAEVGHKVEKAVYEKEEPKLREALLNAQFDLSQQGKSAVLILIGGVDGAGKGETVNLLNEWMDPRHIRTVAYGDPSDEERERPMMWRFWRSLPPSASYSDHGIPRLLLTGYSEQAPISSLATPSTGFCTSSECCPTKGC